MTSLATTSMIADAIHITTMINTMTNTLNNAPLGKQSAYISQYQPDLLFAIARKQKREEIGIEGKLPFNGVDIWNAYEISWLNDKGKPVVAMGEFIIPCDSPNLVESKSIKLYLNSFNNTKITSLEKARTMIEKDLSSAAGSAVTVKLHTLAETPQTIVARLPGIHLDALDIDCNTYLTNPDLLTTDNKEAEETLTSDLLKSNCLVTGQPDWGSVQIQYRGKKINHENLLRYIISFRNHNEFHEQCVERIFTDIITHCQPTELTVYARYTRRGGLDINPWRTNTNLAAPNERLMRQ